MRIAPPELPFSKRKPFRSLATRDEQTTRNHAAMALKPVAPVRPLGGEAGAAAMHLTKAMDSPNSLNSAQGPFAQGGVGRVVVRCVSDQGVSAGAQTTVVVR